MQLGIYDDGRPVTYDEKMGAFVIGRTTVTGEQIRSYSAAGQIKWDRAGIEGGAGEATTRPVGAAPVCGLYYDSLPHFVGNVPEQCRACQGG